MTDFRKFDIIKRNSKMCCYIQLFFAIKNFIIFPKVDFERKS